MCLESANRSLVWIREAKEAFARAMRTVEQIEIDQHDDDERFLPEKQTKLKKDLDELDFQYRAERGLLEA